MNETKETGICKECRDRHVENKWYLSPDDKLVEIEACRFHPRLDNWRVVRTLRTLKYWSLCGEGWKHKHAPMFRMTLAFQRVHRRTAEMILFDYEKPFIDLLIEKGYLEEESDFDDVSRVLRVLPTWRAYVMEYANEAGWKGFEAFEKELQDLALKHEQVTS